ncbi:DNA-processing protein DprA [Sphingobacterium sp. UT-1RO-CII-1]|uniref:DNA-processing protein DprA n=1 Tax=Sphingobacterium sp. UT-1RO-CII-1 TaxID=2995225 RepID=UPI00227BC6EA|nr:DNA-processing protein DprA [Sphingobacterium sp. UT-1RO-CII-1]MCY4778228.1 DNA-processing protein DprA [Sphingobacterium sp. UT-1RO-CII-1]
MNKLQQIALTQIKGVGPKTGRMLLECFGSPSNIFYATRAELHNIPGLPKTTIDAILSKDCLHKAEEEMNFLEKNQIQLLWINDTEYPTLLKQCDDAPLILYFKGQISQKLQKSISIVGTRNATPYGKRLCEDLISSLQGMDIQIVSGLAHGIDSYAHRAALRHNIPTIGVLGHGLQMVYPAANRDLAAQMTYNGGVITEFSSTTKPERMHFPARNRIIAGMSHVTIVIEAAIKGGALITAEIANSYHRDVCAFPGAVGQTYSEGCNYLIKTNRAHLIRHADDLIYIMGWEQTSKTKNIQLSLPTISLSADEQKIYTFMATKGHISFDDIAHAVNYPISKLSLILLQMEMNGHIISLPGKRYQIVK